MSTLKMLIGALLLAGMLSATAAPSAEKTMKLALMVSYDDEANVSGEKEQALIDRLFGQMKEAGFQAVLWRSMRGGEAMFKSKQYQL